MIQQSVRVCSNEAESSLNFFSVHQSPPWRNRSEEPFCGVASHPATKPPLPRRYSGLHRIRPLEWGKNWWEFCLRNCALNVSRWYFTNLKNAFTCLNYCKWSSDCSRSQLSADFCLFLKQTYIYLFSLESYEICLLTCLTFPCRFRKGISI